MRKGGITRSTGFQILLYFLLAVGALCSIFCILITGWLWNWGAHKTSFEEFERRFMMSKAYDHLSYICDANNAYSTLDAVIDAFNWESDHNNVKYAIYTEEGNHLIWSNVDFKKANSFYKYEAWFYRPIEEESVTVVLQSTDADVTEYNVASEQVYESYRAVLYVDTTFGKEDEFRNLHMTASYWYREMDLVYMGAVGGFFLSLICFIWLLCNAGHGWRREGIAPGVLSNIYLDFLTAFFGFGAICIVLVAAEVSDFHEDYVIQAGLIAVVLAVEAVWCTLYLRELALRFKLGKWWRHTFVYGMCRLCWRMLRFLGKGVQKLIVHLPEIHLVAVALLFVTGCEFLGLMWWGEAELFVVWIMEKLVLIPLVLYCALAFQKLRKGSRALAQGNLSEKLDTQYLLLQFKEHGEDLNCIGTGISKAVEERLQSERLKTELITNVSHDLKTPLTSVINYADLLAVAAAGNAEDKEVQIQEYSEVLLRQAKRLKKLLEDLVEASKAATGNVELKPVPCELGVMLTQAAGEYEERFAQKDLRLVMKKPEEEIRILADGRQLWRVFENLLNNICKYAQENSRVYLNMEQKENQVEIIFRNISKYELDVSPEELTERFVRGDASRHMEGSGLGLSIAKSLVELQDGTMEIMTDGDLFKVILRFVIYTT